MNTPITKSLLLLSMLALLQGCVVIKGESGSWDWDDDWMDEQRENREAIASLALGTTRTEVIDLMGTPNASEAFSRDGVEYRVLFYRTHHRHSDGDTTRDETTPLIFKDDNLIGWGDGVLASIR